MIIIFSPYNSSFIDRHVEKEHLDDYIAKKREMFLVQVIVCYFHGVSAPAQWAKLPKKAVCRSVYLTTWHCILSTELTKRTPSDCFFGDFAWRFCPLLGVNRLDSMH